jgi:hypothetical protein
MSQVPVHYIGDYKWHPAQAEKNINQHERNRAVFNSKKRRKLAIDIQKLRSMGKLPELTNPQKIAGARRVI